MFRYLGPQMFSFSRCFVEGNFGDAFAFRTPCWPAVWLAASSGGPSFVHICVDRTLLDGDVLVIHVGLSLGLVKHRGQSQRSHPVAISHLASISIAGHDDYAVTAWAIYVAARIWILADRLITRLQSFMLFIDEIENTKKYKNAVAHEDIRTFTLISTLISYYEKYEVRNFRSTET